MRFLLLVIPDFGKSISFVRDDLNQVLAYVRCT